MNMNPRLLNHPLCDLAVGMVLGYALARGLSHRHEESPLSEGADAMGEDRTQRAAPAARRRGAGDGGSAAGMEPEPAH